MTKKTAPGAPQATAIFSDPRQRNLLENLFSCKRETTTICTIWYMKQCLCNPNAAAETSFIQSKGNSATLASKFHCAQRKRKGINCLVISQSKTKREKHLSDKSCLRPPAVQCSILPFKHISGMRWHKPGPTSYLLAVVQKAKNVLVPQQGTKKDYPPWRAKCLLTVSAPSLWVFFVWVFHCNQEINFCRVHGLSFLTDLLCQWAFSKEEKTDENCPAESGFNAPRFHNVQRTWFLFMRGPRLQTGDSTPEVWLQESKLWLSWSEQQHQQLADVYITCHPHSYEDILKRGSVTCGILYLTLSCRIGQICLKTVLYFASNVSWTEQSESAQLYQHLRPWKGYNFRNNPWKKSQKRRKCWNHDAAHKATAVICPMGNIFFYNVTIIIAFWQQEHWINAKHMNI